MDDTRTIRTRTSSQLRELDTHLAVAAEALSRPDLRPEQARESLEHARQVLAQILADRAARRRPPAGPASPALVRRVELPPVARSSRSARVFARETCLEWSLPSTVTSAATDVASELVANAAAHTAGTVVLALELSTGALVIRAWDDGKGLPRVLPYRPGVSERGLGLRLVKQLSTRWGAAPDGHGKWVWASIAVDEGALGTAEDAPAGGRGSTAGEG